MMGSHTTVHEMATDQDDSGIELSPFDQIMMACYVRVILCFPTPNTSDAVQSLECGIGQTMNQLPYLKGSVKKAANSRTLWYPPNPAVTSGKVSTVDLPDLSYPELEARSMPMSALDETFCPVAFQVADPSSKVPIVAFQITVVSGGIFLCACVHHCIMDGTGIDKFLCLIAQNTSSTAQTSLDPHEAENRRTILEKHLGGRPPANRKLLSNHAEYRIFEGPVPVPALALADAPPNGQRRLSPTFPKMKSRLFKLTSSMLVRLKAAMSTHLGDLTNWVSTNDCVSALIWMCVIRARATEASFANDQMTKLGQACNGRRKLSPELLDYLGNVNLYAVASFRACDMINVTPETSEASLAAVALQIRRSIDLITPQHIGSAMSLMESLPDPRVLKPNWNFFLGKDMTVTSWTDFKVTQARFGDQLDRPGYVRCPAEAFDGIGVFLPTAKVDGVVVEEGANHIVANGAAGRSGKRIGKVKDMEAIVGLKSVHMDSFCADPLWKMWAGDATWTE